MTPMGISCQHLPPKPSILYTHLSTHSFKVFQVQVKFNSNKNFHNAFIFIFVFIGVFNEIFKLVKLLTLQF